MTTDTKAELQTYLEGLGLTYTPTFIPTPQPGVESPQLHWSIGLHKGNQSASFHYSQGLAHVKGYQQFHKSKYDKRIHNACYRKTCETGSLYRPSEHDPDNPWMKAGTQPAPGLMDVLYCLVSDASVRNYSTYEEWGPEYGYDEDSRKGEATYRACQKQTTDFLRVLGGGKIGRNALDILEKLEELYQDY